ncbi:MAG: Spi family protease inhibitor [Rikenellaceae bacterium]
MSKKDLLVVEKSQINEVQASYKISIEDAKMIALQFVEDVNKDNTRADGRSYTVEDVDVVRVTNDVTRSLQDQNGIDTLLYAVNLADNNGYLLVGADRRSDPVFAYIDSGDFSSESVSENPNFEFFLDMTSAKIAEDIANYSANEAISTRS